MQTVGRHEGKNLLDIAIHVQQDWV